jgi:hypothetical protein
MYDLNLLHSENSNQYFGCIYCGKLVGGRIYIIHSCDCTCGFPHYSPINLGHLLKPIANYSKYTCNCLKTETDTTLAFLMLIFFKLNEKYFSSIEPEITPYITVCSKECFEESYNIVPDKLKVYLESIYFFKNPNIFLIDSLVTDLVIKEIMNRE